MSAKVLAFFLVSVLLAAQCHAAFVSTIGGCGSGTSGYTIHSATENDEATLYLVEKGIRSAALPAHVSNGVLSWDNGDAVTWQPSSFVAPSNGDYQVLLRYNGKWGLASGSVSVLTFLCSSVNTAGTTSTTTTPTTSTTSSPASSASNTSTTTTGVPTTTSTTTTEVPTTTSTTTTSTTTTSTTAVPAVVPTVASVIQALKNTVLDSVSTISVMDFTSNVVYLPTTSAVVQNLEALRKKSSIIALRFGASGPVSALLTDAATASIGFQVPNNFYNVSTTTTYTLSLVTLDGATTAVAVTAQLSIVPVITVLQSMPSAVKIREESSGNSRDILSTARFAGEGTTVPYTTDVSLAFTSTLTFTMVNNGVIGNTCSPASSSPLPYFVTRYDLRFVVPATYVSRVSSGRKSICASYNGKSTVIASLTIQHLGATTTASTFAVNASIPVVLLGGSTTSLAKGGYTAFVSSSATCSAVTDEISLLPLNTFRSTVDTAGTPSALLLTADETHIGLYVCMRRVSTNTKFAVTYNGAPVTIVRNTAAALPTANPVLTIFNGSSGSVDLTEFIRPPSDASELDAYTKARTTLGLSYVAVRFIPVKAAATATAAVRAAACQQVRSAEATQGVSNGVMQVSYPLYLQRTNGVLCAAEQYLRIDYVVVRPGSWLVSMADTSNFSANTFVLSSGSNQDAVPITVQDTGVPVASAISIAVRFSSDSSCAFGHTSAIGTYGSQQYVSYPTTLLGIYTVCAGIYSSRGTSMFVSTGTTVAMASYEVARSNWMLDAGIDGSEWTPCGSVSMCGLQSKQKLIRVCNGAVNSNAWPARLDGAFELPGSLTVRMSGNLYEASALALMNEVYVVIDAAFSQCQEFGVWPMSTDDGASYGPGVVVLSNHPQVALAPSVEISGVVVGFVPWDGQCKDRHAGADIMVARDAAGVSVIDLSNFLYDKIEGYYAVCTHNDVYWARVSDTYVKVVSGVATIYRAEGISTGTPLTNGNGIHLYQTQTATWSVIGTFSPAVDMVFRLVWNDATCTADAAYTTALTYVSPSTANVVVEASLITAVPTGVANAVLYPCYTFSAPSAPAAPLPFEQHRHRAIIVTQLTLASLYYLPEFALSYKAPEDTRVLFTDPSNPPITRVALHRVSSRTDTPQCGAAADAVAVLTAEADDLNQRWITVPAALTQGLAAGAAGEVYVKLCATASSGIDPEFVAVDAFLVLDSAGTNLKNTPMALRLSFLPLNSSSDLLEYAVGKKELVKYASSVLNVPESTVLVASLGNNAFELFVHPPQTTDAAPDSSSTPTQQLYSLLSKNTNLPLYARSVENASAVFALATVEGVLLADQSSIVAYPLQKLKTSGTSTTVNNLSGLSIALFCVVVAPTTIGFVAFSVQQTIPTLIRSKLEKKAEVYPETGDSPPPRNPRGAGDKEIDESSSNKGKPKSDIPLSVVPRAEDTTDNPLYDSDDEPPTQQAKDMGSSPPLCNDTFAMERKKPVPHTSVSEDDLK